MRAYDTTFMANEIQRVEMRISAVQAIPAIIIYLKQYATDNIFHRFDVANVRPAVN